MSKPLSAEVYNYVTVVVMLERSPSLHRDVMPTSSRCLHSVTQTAEEPRETFLPSNDMAAKILSDKPLIDPTADCRDTRFGSYCEVGARTILLGVAMGDYTYVANDSQITSTQLGKFCSIAAMTRINPGNHPMQRASQSHFTYRASAYFPGEADEEAFFDWRRAHAVTIGHDVWIGHGAIILPGRTVGLGSVVAAGAIVTKDVPPYTIVAGNPARPVRQRFD